MRERIGVLLWRIAWLTLCRWTPKKFGRGWRNFVLRGFGCQITGTPMIHPSAKVYAPWRLTLSDRSVLAEKAELYNLGHIKLGPRVVIAQQAYLCGGSHDFTQTHQPLTTADIEVGHDVFIGMRALVLPGVHIGNWCIVGAGSVVTKDVPDHSVAAGNPAKVIKPRPAPHDHPDGTSQD